VLQAGSSTVGRHFAPALRETELSINPHTGQIKSGPRRLTRMYSCGGNGRSTRMSASVNAVSERATTTWRPGLSGDWGRWWSERCGARTACGSVPWRGCGSVCTRATDRRGSACRRSRSASTAIPWALDGGDVTADGDLASTRTRGAHLRTDRNATGQMPMLGHCCYPAVAPSRALRKVAGHETPPTRS
jgi:hypothetical protein